MVKQHLSFHHWRQPQHFTCSHLSCFYPCLFLSSISIHEVTTCLPVIRFSSYSVSSKLSLLIFLFLSSVHFVISIAHLFPCNFSVFSFAYILSVRETLSFLGQRLSSLLEISMMLSTRIPILCLELLRNTTVQVIIIHKATYLASESKLEGIQAWCPVLFSEDMTMPFF